LIQEKFIPFIHYWIKEKQKYSMNGKQTLLPLAEEKMVFTVAFQEVYFNFYFNECKVNEDLTIFFQKGFQVCLKVVN